MKSVGIDIGRFSIKVAEVEGFGSSFTLTRLEEIPINQEPTKDTEIDILDALRNLSSQYDHSSTVFTLGMPQNQVVVRRRYFPFKERHKILKSIPFELEDDLPFASESAIYDSKITQFKSPGAEVLAIATPQEKVEQWLQKALDASFDPNIVSPDGLAYSNLLENWTSAPPEGSPHVSEDDDENDAIPIPTSKAQAYLHIGHQSTLLLVRTEGRLIHVRTIDWGGFDIAKKISEKYQLHIVEALKELRKKGFILTHNEGATNDQIVFSDTIRSVVATLGSSLRLSFLEIESEFQVEISECFMSGGVSQLKNIGPFLTQELNRPFNRLKQSQYVSHINFENGTSGESVGAVAIGLAIEGLKRPRNPAHNLLKGTLAKQSQSFKKFIDKWGHTLAIASVFFLVLMVWGVLRESWTEEISIVSSDQLKNHAKNVSGGELKGLKATNSSIQKYIRKKEMEEKNRHLAESIQSIDSSLDWLKKISESTPGRRNVGIDLTKMIIEGSILRAEGYVENKAQLDMLLSSWKSLSKDGKIEKVNPSLPKLGSKIPFHVKLKIERKSSN